MDVRDERSQADDADFAEEEARRAAQEAARESGAPALELEVGDELDLNVKGGGRPDAPAEVGRQAPEEPAVEVAEVSAAEGLATQMAAADADKGTVYVIFAHKFLLAPEELDRLPEIIEEVIDVKILTGGGVDKLGPLAPIWMGRYSGATAALLDARKRFGAGDYGAIPLRNITVKEWRVEKVERWS